LATGIGSKNPSPRTTLAMFSFTIRTLYGGLATPAARRLAMKFLPSPTSRVGSTDVDFLNSGSKSLRQNFSQRPP
jgi:hypothetical protein